MSGRQDLRPDLVERQYCVIFHTIVAILLHLCCDEWTSRLSQLGFGQRDGYWRTPSQHFPGFAQIRDDEDNNNTSNNEGNNTSNNEGNNFPYFISTVATF